MTLLVISYESCEAEMLVNDRIATIQSIMSKEPGKGHARKCLEKIEIIARNKKVREIWFPTVINPRLEKLLENMQYKFVNFGKHHKMPDANDVVGYKKILRDVK